MHWLAPVLRLVVRPIVFTILLPVAPENCGSRTSSLGRYQYSTLSRVGCSVPASEIASVI